jgi:hypothetical protein
VDLAGRYRIEGARVCRVVTGQAGNQINRQQYGQYEQTLTEPVSYLVALRNGTPGFLFRLRQADLPCQIYCVASALIFNA